MFVTAEFVRVTLTLYMLLILLRWFGPWISYEIDTGRLRWTTRLTDPLINKLRQILPPMGPMDFGPIAALVVVWLTRDLTIAILINQ